MKLNFGTKTWIPRISGFRKLASVALFSAAAMQMAVADIPDSASTSLAGMYEVATSSDPMFPKSSSQEWFLDFGNGMQGGATSGKVAVSLRQNPNVSVRIMVWQYFPAERMLLIGNQTDEGSARAVARGAWTMADGAGKISLNRQNVAIVLKRADPGDY